MTNMNGDTFITILYLSNAHLTLATYDSLMWHDVPGVRVTDFGDGIMCQKTGTGHIPNDIAAVFQHMDKNGIERVVFSEDGPVNPNLPIHERRD